MKTTFILCVVSLLLQAPCFARDFIVEFVEENYQETQSSFSYTPVIYHSIQVRSKAGPKMLILKGDDSHYRKWLRHYIAEGKEFIVKVPDDENDLFIKSSAFEIDVTRVHPLNLNLYRLGEEKNKGNSNQYELGKIGFKSTDKNKINREARQDFDKKKAQKDQIAQKRKQVSEARKKASDKKIQAKKAQTKEDEKKRLEQEKFLETQAQKQAAEDLKQKEDLDKKREQLLATLAEQKVVEEQLRQEELEQRWNELKKRLLEDERIRGLGQAARRREIEKRWLELKQRFDRE